MPFYLSEWENLGTAPQGPGARFVPVGWQPGFAAIDLRPDGGRTLDGGGLNACILYAPTPVVDARAVPIGDDGLDPIPVVSRQALQNKLGITVRETRLDRIVMELMMSPRANAWKPLRPEALGSRYSVYCGPLACHQNVIRGGVDLYERLQESGGVRRRRLARDGFDLAKWRDVLRWLRRKRVITWAVLISAAAALGVSAFFLAGVLATDAFTRADAANLGANWTQSDLFASPGIFSNSVDVTAINDFNVAYYDAVAWPDDHYAQVVCTSTLFNGYGPAVIRYDVALESASWYFGGHENAQSGVFDSVIVKVASAAFTDIATNATDIAASDTVYLEAQGTSLLLKVNGSNRVGPSTDATFSSGEAGLLVRHGTANVALLDDWEGGDFAAAGFDAALAAAMQYPTQGPTLTRYRMVPYGETGHHDA